MPKRYNSKVPGFNEFWALYPRKVGVRNAEKSFARACKDTDISDIMAGLHEFIRACPWRNDIQFCPHPATWLNQGRWADEYEAADAIVDAQILEAARRLDQKQVH